MHLRPWSVIPVKLHSVIIIASEIHTEIILDAKGILVAHPVGAASGRLKLATL